MKQVLRRPKSDELDAVWLAKLNEGGMLRRSFVPPVEIRRLRDYTRLRIDLIQDRSRHVQRLEKLLEDALIKLSTVATDITGVSARAMIDALIAGERDPRVLAGLARGRMRVKRAALVEAFTGRFCDHHATSSPSRRSGSGGFTFCSSLSSAPAASISRVVHVVRGFLCI